MRADLRQVFALPHLRLKGLKNPFRLWSAQSLEILAIKGFAPSRMLAILTSSGLSPALRGPLGQR